MRIILQVRKRRGDVATRQSNGFFVVQSRHRGKNPAGHSKVNVTHCMLVCASQREREKKKISSHLFTKRITAMWPQSVWLR